MKELSLHILDVAKNSVTAEAGQVDIRLEETEDRTLTITITDDGRGMSPEFLATVTDPFTTTRTTRPVGLGLPLYRLAAEQTGGSLAIESALGEGTTVTAVFHREHIDCPPLGDLSGTMALLIQGSPWVDFTLEHVTPKGEYLFSSQEIKEFLGNEVPLDLPEVYIWIQEYLDERESEL